MTNKEHACLDSQTTSCWQRCLSILSEPSFSLSVKITLPVHRIFSTLSRSLRHQPRSAMKPTVKTDPPKIVNTGQHRRQPKVREPSEQYIKLSQQESVAYDPSKETSKQLIVLDLNGTLVR